MSACCGGMDYEDSFDLGVISSDTIFVIHCRSALYATKALFDHECIHDRREPLECSGNCVFMNTQFPEHFRMYYAE